MNKARAKELLLKEKTHPAVIDLILIEYFPEWIVWEPETIWAAIRSLTEQGHVPYLIQHKVGAVQTAHNNEGPWEDWEVFNWVAQPFNDLIANFQYVHKPSIADLMVAINTLGHIRKRKYGDEVKQFIASACLDAGVLFVPPPLDFVQDVLDVFEYRCSMCGNIDILDNNRCDLCHAPESALVKTPQYFDWREVRDRWNAVRSAELSSLVLTESLEDVHIAKLATALLVLNEKEDQLSEELAYVGR